MLVLGWWLLPITLFHVAPLYFDAVSWRQLFPALNRPGVLSFLWMRWIRESVSTLLPVAGVGGDVVGARLAHQRGVPGAQATASMVVDITVGAATQLVFVIAGVVLLARGRPCVGCDGMGARDRRGRICGGDRRVRPTPAQQHVWRVDRLGSSTGSEELDVRLRGPRRSDRRRYRCDLSSPLRLVVFQPAAACRMGNRRRRGLADDARPRQALEPDRFVHPGKP